MLFKWLGYSIAFGAIIGLVRLKKLHPDYRPFVWMLIAGFINEIANFACSRLMHTNAVNDFIYILVESLLLITFFKRQRIFKRKIYYQALFAAFVLAWLCFVILIIEQWLPGKTRENYMNIFSYNSYYSIPYNFIAALMSIYFIGILFSSTTVSLARNASFLIAIGLITLFTVKSIIEVFWLYGLGSSRAFGISIFRIFSVINCVVNLIFALAVLWIPTKREYTLR